jgi:phenylpropionate dioxygenase-like ring-hydroxylating dioxygenase large terminal subunit
MQEAAQATRERPSQVDEQVVNRMIDHLRGNTTDMAGSELRIPASRFTSERYAAAERALLGRLPVVAGHGSELPAPGTFITRSVLGSPLLIVRKADGAVAAYLNICRHRGAQVETEPFGAKSLFMCPYHGWSYEREQGRLLAVPFEEMFKPFDKSCNNLRQVDVEERHGLIWVVLEGAKDLTSWLGAADRHVASFGMQKSELYLDKTFDLKINWKLVLEGAIDGSHVQFLHQGTVSNFIQNNACVWGDYGRHGSLIMARKKFALKVREGEEIESAWRSFSSNLYIFPNTMIMAAPDHVELWTVWPSAKDPSRSTVSIRFLIHSDKLDQRMRDRMNMSWEILENAALNEDFPAEEGIQANLAAQPGTSVLYGRHEIGCQHIHRQLASEFADHGIDPDA